ncbi:MAG: HEAT repeat domain-containing protein [Planctomycetota bacterium]|jgi:HEAT repeat protein
MLKLAICALLAVSALALPAPAQEELSGADRVVAAVEKLESAFKDDEGEILQVEAIQAAAGLDDPKVVKEIVMGLKVESDAVQEAAMTALGAMKSKEALEALHDAYRRGTKLHENDKLYSLLLKSIGRHGSPDSIALLKDFKFQYLTIASGRARIMGLGNIRTEESIEALIEMKRKGGGQGRRRGRVVSGWEGKFRQYMVAAITILTGQDFGFSAPDWQAWWRDNKKDLEIEEKRPPVPEKVKNFWEQYWGVAYYEDGEAPKPTPLGPPYVQVKYPTKEQVQEAVKELQAAFGGRDQEYQVATIENYAGVVHPDVIRMISKGLRKPEKVQIAAIDALGWTKHADALKQLHRLYRRDRSLSKKEEAFAHLLKAIGRHGHKTSIKVLMDNVFKGLTLESGKARIMGLGNIREKASVEELIKGMKLAGGNPPRSNRYGQPRFIDWFRLAMFVLTGEDRGGDKESWDTWWRENKKTFRMSKERPKIGEELQDKWERYWKEPYHG